MRDAIIPALKFADALPDAQKKAFAQVVFGAAIAISNHGNRSSIGPASKPVTLKVDAAVHNIGMGYLAGLGAADFKDSLGRLRQALSSVSANIRQHRNYGEVINGNIYPSEPVERESGPVSHYLPSFLGVLGRYLPSRLGGDSQRSVSKGLTDAFEQAGSEKVNLMAPDNEHGYKPVLERRYGLLNSTDDNAKGYAGKAGIGLA
jgi:hypothetical protein